jgi:hypothetical protein
MWTKFLLTAMTVASVLAISGGPLLAADEIHEGKVVSVGGGTITVLDKRDGDNDTFIVNAQTKLLRNGKPAKLSDIQPGDMAKVTAVSDGDKLVAKEVVAVAPE